MLVLKKKQFLREIQEVEINNVDSDLKEYRLLFGKLNELQAKIRDRISNEDFPDSFKKPTHLDDQKQDTLVLSDQPTPTCGDEFKTLLKELYSTDATMRELSSKLLTWMPDSRNDAIRKLNFIATLLLTSEESELSYISMAIEECIGAIGLGSLKEQLFA